MEDVQVLVKSKGSENIRLVETNLLVDPTLKQADLDFWVKTLDRKGVPYVLGKFDFEMGDTDAEKRYRRSYGLFVDMRTWYAVTGS